MRRKNSGPRQKCSNSKKKFLDITWSLKKKFEVSCMKFLGLKASVISLPVLVKLY